MIHPARSKPMLRRIERLAEISVARGCGFAGLAIATFMLGLSWDMMLATKVGGLLLFLVCLVLLLKAWHAERRPHRTTELWGMLEESERPPAAIAQQVTSAALKQCYLRYARRTAGLAAILLAISLTLGLQPSAIGEHDSDRLLARSE